MTELEGKRTQQSRAAETIRKILVAAGHEFQTKGFEGASLNQIIATSGVTKGGLRYHFPGGKEDLAVRILRDTLNVDGLKPQKIKLQEVVDTGMILAYRITQDPALDAALRLSVDYKARDTYGTPWSQWIAINTAQFEEAKQRGELAAGVDPGEQAYQIAGPWAGLVLICHAVDGHLRHLEERVSHMYFNLLTAIANPRFLSQVDFSVDRGHKLYDDFLNSGPLTSPLEG